MRRFKVRIQGIALVGLALAISSAGLARGNDPILPRHSLTPGDTLDVTRDDVCVSGYSRNVRDVPVEVKQQVYAEYGIASHRPHQYEVDHLISLELGGSNSVRNLWPQSYLTSPWNAHVKDKLENKLHSLVCSGQIDLKVAQRDIARNWISAYKKYMGTFSGRVVSTPQSSIHPPGWMSKLFAHGRSTRVWVNTRSGKYFFPGSRYYGKTREGRYMREKDALQQGYQAAKGKE